MLDIEVSKGRRCIFEIEGKRVNPYHLIEGMKYTECTLAVRKLVPRIDGKMQEIMNIISSNPVLSKVQKQFFSILVERRYEEVLFPVCKKAMELEQSENYN